MLTLKKASIIHIIWLSLALFLASPTQADNYVFATSNYPPFQYLEDGKPKGFKLDILNEAFKRAGHTYEIKFLPWARVLKYIENGNADFTTGEWKRSRTEYADYSEVALFNSTISFFTQKHRKIAYSENMSDLEDYSIITVNKYSYGRIFDYATESGQLTNIYSAPDSTSALAMLHNGRGDILVSNRHVAIAVSQNMDKANNLLELKPPLSINATHVLYTKEKDLRRLRKEIDAALSSMITDGTLSKLNND